MNDDRQSASPGPDAFTRMWSDFAAQMMRSGWAFSPDQAPPDAAREMRAAMLRAWTEYCDQFMRSAEFLDSMRQSLAASVEARKQLNDFLGRMQHEFQGASRQDVDQIMLSLRHLERRLVDEVERLSQQVEQVSGRLGAVEAGLAGAKKQSGGGEEQTAEEDGG